MQQLLHSTSKYFAAVHPKRKNYSGNWTRTLLIKGLKVCMCSDPVAPGTPPLPLHCIDVSKKEDFLEHLAGQYTYEVLGGMHTVAARKELLEEVTGIFRGCCRQPLYFFHFYFLYSLYVGVSVITIYLISMHVMYHMTIVMRMALNQSNKLKNTVISIKCYTTSITIITG